MLRFWTSLLTAVLLVVAIACSRERNSPVGFRLPGYGDVQRGKAAFVALECNKCHQVSGMNLPAMHVVPPVPVVLGGETTRQMTDGYLVASIINPSHALAPYPAELTTVANGKSRMPEYADNITVRQLTDIVAFLQSQYKYRPAGQTLPAAY